MATGVSTSLPVAFEPDIHYKKFACKTRGDKEKLFREISMASRRGRIVLGVFGEGHKEAVLKLAKGLSEAGFEVVYTDLTEPHAIVASALQECADHIGITMLQGSNFNQVAEILRLLKKEGADGIGISAGGFLSEADASKLKTMGVMEVFSPGTTFDELIDWSQKNVLPVGVDN
ncbi:MAG: methylmalonyl-CoA mutase [Deltaproteobacteria bacterium CG_4_8_14_3_um_filter_51_11]|nr:methylmalonyl-CoA mutase [bacterium]NCP08554.1 methylmalonyl-CoA mutase [bacterium]PIX18189.1 MAG: methylmalonyl-CoA mutase [Deltaproteobacteria bacterium CG_4_8_14_3_um_filter_51_11]PJB37770.1 MAG: methylmalonyl-CoA mutase [Deltaproteobacteria bacterium CG_4_9_14_3_um_filter_51_14]